VQGADDEVAPRDSAPLDDGEVERDAVESPTLPHPAAASRECGSMAELLRQKLDRAIVAEAWDAVRAIRERIVELERAEVVDLAEERARRGRG
jgi:hypothetical protein